MDLWLATLLLYLVGIIFLVAEIFIPSFGILGTCSLVSLSIAVWRTFQVDEAYGYVAVLLLAVCIPASIYYSVKYWHRTPIGRKISPPNPVLTAEDTSVDLRELQALIGQRGRTLSPLRPVGACEFGGRRVECEAHVGMIDSGVDVEAVGLRGRCLSVRSV